MKDIKVLIADDTQTDRMVLSKIVRGQGGQVVEASNGNEAIALYKSENPDIVLMDVMMPELDGKTAARAIKKAAGEDFVPLIFLTSLSDAQSLADCLSCGGDDFLSKPYNPVVLQAKIRSFSRMRQMHIALQEQRDSIIKSNEHMLHEQHVAKAVFDNVAHAGCLAEDNIRYLLSPLSVFNGDVLLAATKPDGGMHVVLGDFTGHGLPAAIGAMPLAEIFYGMTAKGFALREILREINLKLKGILPVGFFCCAALVDLNIERQSLSIWMGGVPDCYLLRARARRLEVLSSSNLPLGVLSNEQLKDEFSEYPICPDDRLFLWSDGILESQNEEGDMFGEERLRQVFEQTEQPEQVFDQLEKTLKDFIGSSERNDDITVMEVRMMKERKLKNLNVEMTSGPIASPVDWSMDYRLGPETLKNFNPLPLLNHIMMEVPGLRAMGGQLYTVMAELFSNAFEHGVLGLDSAMKSNAEGFARYYHMRQQKLEALTDGYIQVSMKHEGDGHSGSLCLTVEDSGKGFDHIDCLEKHKKRNELSGRGISLIQEICESLIYKGQGNVVQAVIRWPLLPDAR